MIRSKKAQLLVVWWRGYLWRNYIWSLDVFLWADTGWDCGSAPATISISTTFLGLRLAQETTSATPLLTLLTSSPAPHKDLWHLNTLTVDGDKYFSFCFSILMRSSELLIIVLRKSPALSTYSLRTPKSPATSRFYPNNTHILIDLDHVLRRYHFGTGETHVYRTPNRPNPNMNLASNISPSRLVAMIGSKLWLLVAAASKRCILSAWPYIVWAGVGSYQTRPTWAKLSRCGVVAWSIGLCHLCKHWRVHLLPLAIAVTNLASRYLRFPLINCPNRFSCRLPSGRGMPIAPNTGVETMFKVAGYIAAETEYTIPLPNLNLQTIATS